MLELSPATEMVQILRLFEPFYSLSKWTYWGAKSILNMETVLRGVMCSSVGTMSRYRPYWVLSMALSIRVVSFGGLIRNGHVLPVPSFPEFSYYSDLFIRHQPR